MANLIRELAKIEREFPDFFEKQGKDIPEFITKGIFKSGTFINKELPEEIILKIHEVFDRVTVSYKH